MNSINIDVDNSLNIKFYLKDWNAGQQTTSGHHWPLNADLLEHQMLFQPSHDHNTFPFTNYDERQFMDVGILCIIKEDTVKLEYGFNKHPHNFMGIDWPTTMSQ